MVRFLGKLRCCAHKCQRRSPATTRRCSREMASAFCERFCSRASIPRLAHFVRLDHSGVEAETLVIKSNRLHVALEVLNFFPCPVWVGLCCGQAPRSSSAKLSLRGYVHTTSCGVRPEKYMGGSMVLCSAQPDSGAEPRQDFLYCAPFSRTEIGEHALDASCGTALHFLFARRLQVAGVSLEEGWVDVRSARGDGSPELLIPTTRAQHCAMDASEWQRRGAPEGVGEALCLAGAAAGLLEWRWDAGETLPFELVEVLFIGCVTL